MKTTKLKQHAYIIGTAISIPIIFSSLINTTVSTQIQDNPVNECSCAALSDNPDVVVIDNETFKALPDVVEAPAVTAYVYRLKNDVQSNNVNYKLRKKSHKALEKLMKDQGFVGIEGMSLHQLRRLNIAYQYDALFWDMHERTGFPISLFFAYFVYEATRNGIESDLWMNHWNPGGIKYKGDTKYVYRQDDCLKACKFASLPNYEAAIKQWAIVFNAGRYKQCKSKRTPEEICNCIKKAGYHTDNSNKARADIMESYWSYRKMFPR